MHNFSLFTIHNVHFGFGWYEAETNHTKSARAPEECEKLITWINGNIISTATERREKKLSAFGRISIDERQTRVASLLSGQRTQIFPGLDFRNDF